MTRPAHDDRPYGPGTTLRSFAGLRLEPVAEARDDAGYCTDGVCHPAVAAEPEEPDQS